MIVGWKHPLDGRVYALDDFTAFSGVLPEPLLRAMARKITLDTRHSGTNITITGGLSCPRKTLITRILPSTPDPSKMWKMQRGTWLHEIIGLTLGENDEWWTEEVAEDKCVFEGELFGVKMSCKVDALRKDFAVLLDWKFRADGAEKFIDPSGRAKDEDAAQLNMARMLIEQVTGKDLEELKMYVWVMAGEPVRTVVPYMTVEQVGGIRPGGGQYTIKEIFNYLSHAMKWWTENPTPTDEEARKLIASLPMVGQHMYVNARNPQLNMCTRYCEVNEECFACEGM